MAHNVTVSPFRLREHSATLRVDVLRGVGYTWRCSCGEHGKVFGRHHDARTDGRKHTATAM